MDETTSLVYRGCYLAKELEARMPNLANQPDVVSSKCEEIIRVFSNVKERLLISHGGQMTVGEAHESAGQQNINAGSQMQEWLRSHSRSSNAMGLLHAQIIGERSGINVHGLPEMGGRDVGGLASFQGGGGQLQAVDTSAESSRPGSSSQRQRRRKDDADKRTIWVPAPRMGNTEIPPDDGYTWRKYGQKEILGTRFPRAYYRCTHQKLYHCPAKKQVQKLDADPYTFEVTYRGDHTCHMSSTAPSIPPSSLAITQEMLQVQDHTSSTIHLPLQSSSSPSLPTFSHWLSMNINPPEEGTSNVIFPVPHMHRDFSLVGASTTTTTTTTSTTAGPWADLYRGQQGLQSSLIPKTELLTSPSTVRSDHGRDVHDYEPVADMADFVFNSAGSSSNNSMELIFSSMETDQKWDEGEKPN